MSRRPADIATTVHQKESLAELPKRVRYVHYERCFEDEDASVYFQISVKPITKRAEDDMELLSGLANGELYLKNFDTGIYACARCTQVLYSSRNKYVGPCVWPTFRCAINDDVLIKEQVEPYYAYRVCVQELYCSKCELFIGHCFEDGQQKGDSHTDARWRHW